MLEFERLSLNSSIISGTLPVGPRSSTVTCGPYINLTCPFRDRVASCGDPPSARMVLYLEATGENVLVLPEKASSSAPRFTRALSEP